MIEVSTGDERIPAGWKLTVTNQYQKVCILFMISIVVLHVRHDVHTGSGEICFIWNTIVAQFIM